VDHFKTLATSCCKQKARQLSDVLTRVLSAQHKTFFVLIWQWRCVNRVQFWRVHFKKDVVTGTSLEHSDKQQVVYKHVLKGKRLKDIVLFWLSKKIKEKTIAERQQAKWSTPSPQDELQKDEDQ